MDTIQSKDMPFVSLQLVKDGNLSPPGMQKYLLSLRYSLNNVVRDHVRQCLSLISAAKSTQCNTMGIPCRAWQGVSQMLYPDQPSMCLVSNGAELVVLSKRLFLERANDACMRHIRQTVRSLVKLVYRQINITYNIYIIDDLRKSRGLHSVNAYRHGLYIYIYQSMPAGVAQSSHAFVGGTVSTWAR